MLRFDDSHQIAFYQGNTGTLDRHVGSGAHGNTDICCGECRGIVDPISRHCHSCAFRLQVSDNVNFFIWHHFCLEIINAQLARDRFGGATIVACAHDHSQAHRMQLTNRGFGRRFDWIGNAEKAECISVYAQPNRGFRFFL